MLARSMDDADMGGEVAQEGVIGVESSSGDEIREPRPRKRPSDPTSREIKDHVLTGRASFPSWCAACGPDQEHFSQSNHRTLHSLLLSQFCFDLHEVVLVLSSRTLDHYVRPVCKWRGPRHTRQGHKELEDGSKT